MGVMSAKPRSVPPADEDETRRKFREALEAKKSRRGEDHLDGPPQPAHTHGPVDAKRVFRRKTG